MNLEDKQLLEVLEKRISQLEAQVALLQSHAVVEEETESDLLVAQNEDSVAQEELKSETSVDPIAERQEQSQSIDLEVADRVIDNSVSDNAEQLSVSDNVSDKVEDKLLEQVAVQEIQSDSKEDLSASSVNAEANTDASEEIKSVFVENTKNKYTELAPKPQKASLESRIGKKLFPIAGSALVLFAIILFGSLIRPHLTDEIKAGILAVFSLGVSVFGLLKMKKDGKFQKLYSAVAGCGVASCYVSILVSHFALEVLPEVGLMICLSTWIVAVIMLAKFKSSLFTYICYVGILVSVALTIMRWHDSPLGIVVYLISISGLFAANFSREYKKVLWFFIQFPLVMIAMANAYSKESVSLGILFTATALVLIGQTWYYRKTATVKNSFELPIILSFISLSASGLYRTRFWLVDLFNFNFNDHVHNIIFACTTIALSVYLYKIFYNSENRFLRYNFWVFFIPTAIILPILNYNSFYNDCLGHYLLPSIVLLTLGCILQSTTFRNIGYIYLLFSAIAPPKYMIFNIDPSSEFSISVWVFILVLAAFTYWLRKRYRKCDKIFLLLCIAAAVFLLHMHGWTDSAITYIIAGAVIMALLNKRIRYILFGRPSKIDLNVLLYSLSIVLVYCVTILFNVIISIKESPTILSLPQIIVPSVFMIISVMLTWGVGYWHKKSSLRIIGYVVMPITIVLSDKAPSIYPLLACYILILCAMIWMTIRRYTIKDKCFVSILIGVLSILLGQKHFILGFETWAFLATYSIILNFIPNFKRNLLTGEFEPKTQKVLILFVEALLLPGVFALIFCHRTLFIGHALEGTKTIVTVLICLLCLMLSLINVKKLYLHFKNSPFISIYSGFKYTILLLLVLLRFSVVSYGISIVGILLSTIFVVIGFRYLHKSLRLYGLALSMICVLKLLFFDLTFDNAFYRPISFLIAGILLFLISFIYFRLEKSSSSDKN